MTGSAILYVVVGEPFGEETSRDTEVRLLAVEAATGRTFWAKQMSHDGGYLGGMMAVRNEHLAYCTKTGIVCADARTGQTRWRAEHDDLIPTDQKAPNNVQPTLVLSDEMLFCSTHNEVRAFPLTDGRLAWTEKNSLNYMKSADIFLAQGLVWTGLLNGHDPKTGKTVRTLKQKMQGPMSHDRCYRNRITEEYLINSKTGGSDFVRLDGQGEFPSPWVRATCGLGVLPANGLLYSSPYSGTRSVTAWRPPRKGKPTQLGAIVPLSRNWKQRWATRIPLSGHALIVAGETVVAAGVPMEASFGDGELSSSYAGKRGDASGPHARRTADGSRPGTFPRHRRGTALRPLGEIASSP